MFIVNRFNVPLLEAFEGLQVEIGELALASLGLSRYRIYQSIIIGSLYLASMLIFIFLGVFSFTGGDSFGATVQALLPCVAGILAYAGGSDADKAKANLVAVVKKTFETIREVKTSVQ